MGAAVRLRTDLSAGELRVLAKRAADADQARRLLSLAAVLDGMSRKAAAEIGPMDRQTLWDWVHRYNERGPEGLINGKAPGPRPKNAGSDAARSLQHILRHMIRLAAGRSNRWTAASHTPPRCFRSDSLRRRWLNPWSTLGPRSCGSKDGSAPSMRGHFGSCAELWA